MKPFRFRLARILRLNEAERRQCAIALQQKNSELRSEQEALERTRNERGNAEQSYAGLAGRQTTATDWIGAQWALVGAAKRVKKQLDAVRNASVHVEKAREILAHKAREVETLVRLRRRRREEYEVEFRRDEQKQGDEKAVQRFCRSRAQQDMGSNDRKKLPSQ